MIVFRAFLICVLLMIQMQTLASVEATQSPFMCPVTSPVDSRPEQSINPFDKDAALHHEHGLWVTIPADGVMELTSEDAITFGPLTDWRSTTASWLREDGVEGLIEVTGKRLDTESELTPQTPLSPQRQYVRVGPVTTGLAFPSEGCWKVVGSVGDVTITWIVEVWFGDPAQATPAP